MTSDQKPSNSSPLNENRPDESPALKKSLSLGPDDELPDVGFHTFLHIMREWFPDVVYTVIHYNYVRFLFTHQHPGDPEPITYPIHAREGGTWVGREQIYKLFERFNLAVEKFKEALNEIGSNM